MTTEINKAEQICLEYRRQQPLEGDKAFLAAEAEERFLKLKANFAVKVKEAREKQVAKKLHRLRFKNRKLKKYKKELAIRNRY